MKRSRGKASGRPEPDRPAAGQEGTTAPADPPAARQEATTASADPPAGSEREPVRPRGSYRGTRRRDNPWVFFLLVAATPMVLVLAIVFFSALPPYTPSQAQSQATLYPTPGASATGTAGGPSAARSITAPSPSVFVYEAEDTAHTTLGTGARPRAAAGASGGRVVTRVGHGTPAGDVTFRAVTMSAGGRYELTIYYLIPDAAAHQLTLSVNGHGATAVLTFTPPGGPTRIGALRTVVTLAAGTNTLRFGNATAYGPDLDRVTVGPP